LVKNGNPGTSPRATLKSSDQKQLERKNEMKNSKLLLLVPILMVLSLFLAACGSPKETFPTGRFIKSGSTTHALVFNEDGSLAVMEGSTTLVVGKYSADADIFTFESDNFGCPAVNIKYTFDGTNLTFSYVGSPEDDPCAPRRSDFDNVTYTLSESE
jgi:hypothetical protein